ncbi:hypothetical protein G4B88_015926 [Cannabis sativa]|uniref:Uncharacterized protein n=1 Tax=Cannabis sativa TaxID=3483 RepID=A0A7J6EJI8_CANSA|nr:hypothetical protein G4B88_015926 [Cannabis sativa]
MLQILLYALIVYLLKYKFPGGTSSPHSNRLPRRLYHALDYYSKITYLVLANNYIQFVYIFYNLITKTFLLHSVEGG